eukprot:600987-Amphidinium_carterae.1
MVAHAEADLALVHLTCWTRKGTPFWAAEFLTDLLSFLICSAAVRLAVQTAWLPPSGYAS